MIGVKLTDHRRPEQRPNVHIFGFEKKKKIQTKKGNNKLSGKSILSKSHYQIYV